MGCAGSGVGGRDSDACHRVRRVHECDEGNNDQKNQIDGARKRQPVAAQAAPGVAPQARLYRDDGPDDDSGGGSSHQYLILGSMTTYSRSTPRFAIPMSAAYIVKTPITML